MSKDKLHGGELFGIILFLSIGIDLVVGLWIRSDVLRISFLWMNVWASHVAVFVGIPVCITGCILGYITHKLFNQAVSSGGSVKYILTEGPYRHIRHPFYLSLIMISFSFFLILRSYILIVGLAIVTATLASDAREEEILLLETFKDEYLSYQRRTGIFFPKIFRT
jgi:protein-S-isoprenylcysteine O-methyltransferase Ste14